MSFNWRAHQSPEFKDTNPQIRPSMGMGRAGAQGLGIIPSMGIRGGGGHKTSQHFGTPVLRYFSELRGTGSPTPVSLTMGRAGSINLGAQDLQTLCEAQASFLKWSRTGTAKKESHKHVVR